MRAAIAILVLAVALSPLTAHAIDVWGDQWGTWTRDNSPYNVIGEIRIPPESTLIIEPGVLVNFQGHYKFVVDSVATLLAVGTEIDSIFFTCDTLANPDRWHGIRFIYADSNSQISFCRLEYGRAAGFYWQDRCGGAIYCSYSSPTISYNTISGNSAGDGGYGGGISCENSNPTISSNTISGNSTGEYGPGGGICCNRSNPTITNNTIRDNSTGDYGHGGGIYCTSSNPTITNNSISHNSTGYFGHGGGISCYRSNPMITNNTISDNSAVSPGHGGGIWCSHSSPTISGNIISGNSSNWDGGGIHCSDDSDPTITNNAICGNWTATSGGGIYSQYSSIPTISDNEISGNSATSCGGGIHCYGSSATISSNTISGNSAGSSGGGICCDGSLSSTISGNTISGNWAVLHGGGISCSCGATINVNIISGNSVRWYGGGIFCSSSSITITNTTVCGNRADSLAGGIYCGDSSPTITNSILWGDTAIQGVEIYVEEGANPTVTYCDVQGGWPGTGNIDADPLFAGPYNDDFHLRWHSPCINAGDPSLTDPDGTRSDIGAFYFNLAVLGIIEVYPHDEPIVIPPQGGDITYDGGVLNLSRGNLTVDIWAQAFVPGLTQAYRLWRYNDVTIPFADSIIRADLIEHVPSYAPSGDYSFVTYIGDFPSSIIDSSCMYFAKEEVVYASAERDGWQTLKGWFDGSSQLTEAPLPIKYSLSQNYPNPFNATTTIKYQLPAEGDVKLEVYNLFGQKVATLVDSKQQAGYRTAIWDASDVSTGIYFYRLTAGDYTETMRMMLVK